MASKFTAAQNHWTNLTMHNSVWLEKWYAELPDPLRIPAAVLRGQTTGTTLLPHVLTMNMMYHFTVILLNRSDNRGITLDKSGSTGDRCNQAAYVCHSNVRILT